MIMDKIKIKTDLLGTNGFKLKNHTFGFIFKIFRFVLLISIGYVIIYPLLYMIFTSFRSSESYFDPTITWVTTKVTLDGYSFAMRAINYSRSLLNTIYYEVIAAFIQLASCAIVAYGFSRFEFKEKKIMMAILFITIILPVQATMLPTYINYSHLDIFGIFGGISKLTGVDLRPNLLNTPFVFYLPALFGVGLRSGIIIYIYMQFFKGLPRELEEAAWIDGCGPLKTFIRIIIPSSTVVIFTNMIFSVIWHWNDFFRAAMYLKDRDHFTLAESLAEVNNSLEQLRNVFNNSTASVVTVIMASCVLYVLPILLMYIVTQRRFVKSIDRVGITG